MGASWALVFGAIAGYVLVSNISWIPNGSWRACEEISEFHPVHH